jgi:TMEM175 potassium channel family protein
MSKQRLEAFTDGVMAIIITIMVLELKTPAESNFEALKTGLPAFLAYALSFVNVGIFWNNHHHMLHVTERINGMVL